MCADPTYCTWSLATVRPGHVGKVGSRIVAHRFGIPAIGLVGVGITVLHHLSPRREDLAARINATAPDSVYALMRRPRFPTIAASEGEGSKNWHRSQADCQLSTWRFRQGALSRSQPKTNEPSTGTVTYASVASRTLTSTTIMNARRSSLGFSQQPERASRMMSKSADNCQLKVPPTWL